MLLNRLDRYLALEFLTKLLAVLAALAVVVFMADSLELMRRAAGRTGIDSLTVLSLALLKLPAMLEQVLPFVVLLAALITLHRLSRRQELTVLRAAGVSVWQFTAPLLLLALLIGTVRVFVLNPLAAHSLAVYEEKEARLFKTGRDVFRVGKDGIWLRQRDGEGYAILRADKANTTGQLEGILILRLSRDETLIERLDASTATLLPGMWRLEKLRLSRPGQAPIDLGTAALNTDVTPAQLQDSFAPPRTIASWDLPGMIRTLQDAGFAAKRHLVHWHSLLLTPLLLAAMVYIAAAAALQPPRRRVVMRLIVYGVGAGFTLFFVTDLVTALGMSGRLPVLLAVWFVPLAALMLAVSVLLWREDG
ncbi:MAG: LPS export ABC transporter permease LptG [Holosporales bacterium]|jgi:lipopolysaccharide export system permease protein